MILTNIDENEIIKHANNELKSVLYIAFNYIDAEKIKYLITLDNSTIIKQIKNYMVRKSLNSIHFTINYIH